MLAWERQLRPAELMAVSAYVGTLLGTNPPNPKDPQGDLQARTAPAEIEEVEGVAEEPAPEADSVATES